MYVYVVNVFNEIKIKMNIMKWNGFDLVFERRICGGYL